MDFRLRASVLSAAPPSPKPSPKPASAASTTAGWRFQIGAWLFVLASLVELLSTLGLWLPFALLFHAHSLSKYGNVLEVAAVWLLTAPAPGINRADRPSFLNLGARCCYVTGHLLPIIISCLCAQASLTLWLYWANIAGSLALSLGAVFLLLSLRRYAQRTSDKRVARRLKSAAAIAIVATLSIPIGLIVRFMFPPAWVPWAWTPFLLIALLTWCYRLWAVGSFAFWLRRITRLQHPLLRLRPHLLWLAIALLVGAGIGLAAGEFLLIKARRIDTSPWANTIGDLYPYSWYIGAVAGVIFLPNRLTLLWRKLRRGQLATHR